MLRLRRLSIEVQETFARYAIGKTRGQCSNKEMKATLREMSLLMFRFLSVALLPFPPASVLCIFHYNPGIGELFADSVGAGEVAGFFGGVAFLDQAINIGV